MKDIQITWLSPDELTPYPTNNKKHPTEQVALLAKLIKKYGFDQPIVAGLDKVIIKGEGRWLAAQQLKLKKVPVIIRDMPEDDAKALRLNDNKSAESGWDEKNLKIEFLALKDINYDMSLTGFSDTEISSYIDGWKTNLDEVQKAGESMDGITSVIKVSCPQEMKLTVKEFLQDAINESGFEGVEVE